MQPGQGEFESWLDRLYACPGVPPALALLPSFAEKQILHLDGVGGFHFSGRFLVMGEIIKICEGGSPWPLILRA